MLTDEESRTDDGNAFHSFAPLIQKKFSRKSSLVRGIDKGMKDCCCRVFGSVGWQGLKSMSFSMPQYPFRHLNTSIASRMTHLKAFWIIPHDGEVERRGKSGMKRLPTHLLGEKANHFKLILLDRRLNREAVSRREHERRRSCLSTSDRGEGKVQLFWM